MTTATLEARVEALERSASRWRVLAILGFLLACGMAVLGAAPVGAEQEGQIAELLRARRIEIVGAAGGPVLTLTQNDSGGIIATQSPSGEILVTVTATATGEGVIALADRAGRRLVELAGKPGEGVGVVNTFDEDGRVAVSLLASKGAGVVQTFRGERPTALLGSVRGDGVVAVFDEEGRVRETLPAGRR